jgi:hypothetical protein
MPENIQQRCSNHARRAAAARCPGCARFFCRECITEHEGRVLCAACIGKQLEKAEAQTGFFSRVTVTVFIFLGFLTAWFFFYYTGQSLLALPDAFHDGTLWQTGWMDK